MDIKFKYELGQRVCHHLNPWVPLIVIERLCYDRPGGHSCLYYVRANYQQEKLIGIYGIELDLYEEGAREKFHNEMREGEGK